MNDESTTVAAPQSLEQLLKTSPELQDPATLEGLSDLITKAAPIIQGRRLHNIVDLLAATSDVIEMADDNMVQKLMALYEEGIGGAWTISNALRYAAAQAAHDETPPTIWQSMRRLSKDEDARRGLSMAINLAAELGRQAKASNGPMPED